MTNKVEKAPRVLVAKDPIQQIGRLTRLRASKRPNWSRTEPGSPSPPVMKSKQRLMPRSTS
jgi:hypothetical protein